MLKCSSRHDTWIATVLLLLVVIVVSPVHSRSLNNAAFVSSTTKTTSQSTIPTTTQPSISIPLSTIRSIKTDNKQFTLFSSRAADLTKAIREARADLTSNTGGDNDNDDANLVLQALRGTNLNDDDTAIIGQTIRLVDIQQTIDGDTLPTTYDPILLKQFFTKRPFAVLSRIVQLITVGGGYISRLAFDRLLLEIQFIGQKDTIDIITGKNKKKINPDLEVQRASELRDLLTSLGPFYIKIGQALSIRPDVLSPRSMVELQKLCDKVPSYDSSVAFNIVYTELGKDINELFSEITPEPVAAASLGQVYKAVLKSNNETVAVKVQRPAVLETVSLDLYLAREFGLIIRSIPALSSRLDPVSLLDEFAFRFYQELDYNLECANGIRIEKEMECLKPMVVIPKNYPQYTSRRVHVAQWIYGEKLSQSTAGDVSALVNLGVITYLTQLLESGFFHADPHPGNMLRTTDGKLAIIDFGLMTEVTDDQKYGMVEAIAHLINRDYSEIGQDFINLDFIPKGTDTRPIVPALTKVFDVALAGGGAKSINFQELAADLAEITYEFPFRIPPYFALVIRAISVLEGIALVGNPNFAIIDEAYPYIARRLMTDKSPRLRAALRYMIYGKDGQFDVENVIDLLQAVEKFTSIKDDGDGSSFKVDGVRGNKHVGTAGDFVGSQIVDISDRLDADERFRVNNPSSSIVQSTTTNVDGAGAIVQTTNDERTAREALRFFFDPVQGEVFRQFMLEEIVTVVDASSRQTIQELVKSIGLSNIPVPSFIQAMNPTITESERRMVSQISQLVQFLIGENNSSGGSKLPSSTSTTTTATTLFTTERAQKLIPIIREYGPELRDFGILLVARLTEKFVSRGLAWATVQLQDADTNRRNTITGTTRIANQRTFGISSSSSRPRRLQSSSSTSSSIPNRSFIR